MPHGDESRAADMRARPWLEILAVVSPTLWKVNLSRQ